MVGAIQDMLVQDGPWIRAFSKRVTQRSSGVTREDGVLLDRILAAAQLAGRDREKFYSQRGQLLKGPLEACLIELCLGGWQASWKRRSIISTDPRAVVAGLDLHRIVALLEEHGQRN